MQRAYLICVDGINNNNKFYECVENDDYSIDVRYGRIGGSEQKHHYSRWEKDFYSLIRSKTNKGYKDISDEYYKGTNIEVVKTEETKTIAKIENETVRSFIEELYKRQEEIVKYNYSQPNTVNEAMIKRGEAIIDTIKTFRNGFKDDTIFDYSQVSNVNYHLNKLFTIIPRKMDRVDKYMLPYLGTAKQLDKIIENEEKLLDALTMVVQNKALARNSVSDKDTTDISSTDFLSANGLKADSITYEEEDMIKEKMTYKDNENFQTRFKRAIKIENENTDKRFNDYLNKAQNKETMLLAHGSPSKNWFKIIKDKLDVNKARNGMFGCGDYFATRWRKSAGYMDTHGSNWRSGNADTGFIALFEVATGKPYYTDSTLSGSVKYMQDFLKKKGCDCVFATAGTHKNGWHLYNDEIVVYRNEQITIRYIVELYDRERELDKNFAMSKEERKDIVDAIDNLTIRGKFLSADIDISSLSEDTKQIFGKYGIKRADEVLIILDTEKNRIMIETNKNGETQNYPSVDMKKDDLGYLMGCMKRAFWKSEEEYRSFLSDTLSKDMNNVVLISKKGNKDVINSLLKPEAECKGIDKSDRSKK